MRWPGQHLGGVQMRKNTNTRPVMAHGQRLTALEKSRHFYAQEIRFVANLRSPVVIDAFRHVPREQFFGAPPWIVTSGEPLSLASMGLRPSTYITTCDPIDLYHNILILIDRKNRVHSGHPSTLASWIGALELKRGERVFHAGCGTGYYTAILASAVGDSGRIFAAEVDQKLAAAARTNLAGYHNVAVHQIDCFLADPGNCDAILINAGVTSPCARWLDLLRRGGRMLVPITFSIDYGIWTIGIMFKIKRTGKIFSVRALSTVGIYPCTSMRDPKLESTIRDAFASRKLFKANVIRRDVHEIADSCIIHTADVCLGYRA